MSLYSPFAKKKLGDIRREERAHCWCGGPLAEFKWHVGYGVCTRCTAYVNRRPPARPELERLYGLDLFWNIRQKQKGHPTIENRSALYRADGRVGKWLALIRKYGQGSRNVIEVGCAPGVLLEELRELGYACIGVEVSEDVAHWLRRTTRLDVRSGFFPGIALPKTDLFLAFDVLEHVPSPYDFLKQVSDCLNPGGIAIIQTPINRYDLSPPFGDRFDLFDDVEHLFLFTDRSIEALAAATGLEIVSLAEAVWIGGEVCVLRRPLP